MNAKQWLMTIALLIVVIPNLICILILLAAMTRRNLQDVIRLWKPDAVLWPGKTNRARKLSKWMRWILLD